jgi:TonB family protein
MKQAPKIRLAATLLALAALVIVSSATTRAQEPTPQTAPDVPVHPAGSGMQILTPTEGVNFSPYMNLLHVQVMKNWSSSLPDEYWRGTKGRAIIRFDISRDGTIANISVESTTGTDSLDQAAVNAIRNSSQLTPLPAEFKGSHITVRSAFYYNQQPSQPQPPLPPLTDCSTPMAGTPLAPPFDRLELLAFLAGQTGSLYEARSVCERGIDFTPDASFLAALRSYQAPSDLVVSLANTQPRSTKQPSPERLSAYGELDLALTKKLNKQLASANEDFARALQLAPDSATLHLAYARNLLLVQNYAEAEAQARQSLKLWPEDAEAHVELAMALTLQKRDSEAVLEAREALRIFPGDKPALADLGISLARSGQYKEAIPILKESLPFAAGLPIIHKLLGASLMHAGDFDAAIEELTVFLKTKPDDAETHYFLGVALRGNGKPDEAAAQFREAARIEPGNSFYSAIASSDDSKGSTTALPKPTGPQPEDCFFSDNVYTNTFFAFSYETPKGWVVQKADAGKAIVRAGLSILANEDPTMPDMAKAITNNAHQLLLVTRQTTKGISTELSIVQIQAMDAVSGLVLKSGEDFLKLGTAFLNQTGLTYSVVAKPEQFPIGGRTFWRVALDFTVKGIVSHAVEAVTIEKGYVLLFVFASPDESKLDELVHTMQSIRFTDSQ